MKTFVLATLFSILVGMSGCQAFVDNLDGEHYACNSDEDCGGDGYTCVKKVCLSPHEVRFLDAGQADSDLDATGADQDLSDQGSTDQGNADTDHQDTDLDAAQADLHINDLGMIADVNSQGRDRSIDDVEVMTDASISYDAANEDARGEDAHHEDAGYEDRAYKDSANLDAADAGPGYCMTDNDCQPVDNDAGLMDSSAIPSSHICFSGRCARLDWEAVTNASTEFPRFSSLSTSPGGQAALAYQNQNSTLVDSLQFRYRSSAGWSNAQSVDNDDGSGLEPVLQRAPEGSFWLSYGYHSGVYQGERLRIAHSSNISLGQFDREIDFAVFDGTLRHRIAFNIDDAGKQFFLYNNAANTALIFRQRQVSPSGDIESDLSTNSYFGYTNWPMLVRGRDGMLYGTFNAGYRLYFGMAVENIGFVHVAIGNTSGEGCLSLGLPASSYSCSVTQPFATQSDSMGRSYLCGVVDHRRSDGSTHYPLVLISGDAQGFSGQVLNSNLFTNMSTDPGARCSIVVDDLDRAHIFAPRTDGQKALMHYLAIRDADNNISVESSELLLGDFGQWPEAQVDANGELHIVQTEVTARYEYSYHHITASRLIYSHSTWEDAE